MSCNCKTLKKIEDINAENLANAATISVNFKLKIYVVILSILMSPFLIVKYVLRKWKKLTE